jgi:hypothetical protein
MAAAKAKPPAQKDDAYSNSSHQTKNTENGIPITAGEPQVGAPWTADEYQHAEGGKCAKEKTHQRSRPGARLELSEDERSNKSTQYKADYLRTDILPLGVAGQAKRPGDIAAETAYRNPHVPGITEFDEHWGKHSSNKAGEYESPARRKKP